MPTIILENLHMLDKGESKGKRVVRTKFVNKIENRWVDITLR